MSAPEETPIHDRGYVYLIDSGLGLYKIGHALDPWQRLRDMQVGSPVKLELLAYAECKAETRMGHEGALHFALSRYWKHGEWFEMRPRLLRWCMATFANIGAHARRPDFYHGRDHNRAHADKTEAQVARLLGCEEVEGTDYVFRRGPCEEHAAMAQRALRHPTFPAWRGRYRVTSEQMREWLTRELGRELSATVTSCIRTASWARAHPMPTPPRFLPGYTPEARQPGDLPLSPASRRLRSRGRGNLERLPRRTVDGYAGTREGEG